MRLSRGLLVEGDEIAQGLGHGDFAGKPERIDAELVLEVGPGARKIRGSTPYLSPNSDRSRSSFIYKKFLKNCSL